MGRRRHAGHVFAKVCAPNTKATWQTGSIPLVVGWKKPANDIILSLRVCPFGSFLPSLSLSLSLSLSSLAGVVRDEHPLALVKETPPLGLLRFVLRDVAKGTSLLPPFSPPSPSRLSFVLFFLSLFFCLRASQMRTRALRRILWPRRGPGPSSISLFPLWLDGRAK